MTMRLDIVTNDAGEGVRREHARELGAGVVISVYRLAKLAQMHDLANQAFTRQLEQTHQIIGDYCLRSGSNVNVLFANKAIFVAGQLLKGSRSTYEAATELGELLERLGGSELYMQRDITREELLAFAEQISIAHRSGPGSFRSPTSKIRLRPVADSARLRGLELDDLTADERIVRMYASAVVIMRRFFEDLQASRYVLPRRIKRIAQTLVDLSDGSKPAFLGVTEVRNANFDEAGRAVNTAILAVSMARELTLDRAILSQIAMAAMMHDVARPRAMALSQAGGPAMPGMQGPSVLSEDQEDHLAAGAAAVLTALGRVNEPSITRTVLTFEALWLRRQTWLGPVYWGARAPTLHAKLIAIARRYNDLLTPEPGLAPPTPDYAVAVLSAELKDMQDRSVLRMLVSALGLLPMGTVVQLATGEVAEVVRGPAGAGDLPRVRLMADPSGKPVQPIELELAQDPRRQVARVVSVEGWRKGLELGPSVPDAPYGDERESEPPAPPAPAPRVATPPAAEPALRARAAQPSGHDGGGVDSGEHQSSSSLPSLGTSPSAVAEAMGRMINDSLKPPAPDRAPSQHGDGLPARGTGRRAIREPTARGNLAATPLPHVLVYMLDHALTGSVVFEGSEAENTVYFVAGVPAKIRLHDRVAPLGSILVHGGLIEARAVEQAVDGARRLGILIGEYLVGHDLVSREALLWALEAQLLNKIAHLANLEPEVTYSYYREVDLLDGWGGGDVPVGCPLNPILASVRNWTDRARIRATLSRLGRHALALHEEAAIDNLALSPEEQAALDVIRAEGLPLSQLFARKIADEDTVSSLVYALAVTRQFAFKGQKNAPMAVKRGQAWKVAPGAAASSAAPPPPSAPPAPIPAMGTLASIVPPGAPSPASAPPVAAIASAPPASPRSGPPAASARPNSRATVPPSSPNTRSMPPAARPPGGSVPQIRPISAKKVTIVGLHPGADQRAPGSSAAPPAAAAPASAPPQPNASGLPVVDAPTEGEPPRIPTPTDGMRTVALPPSFFHGKSQGGSAPGARPFSRSAPALPSKLASQRPAATSAAPRASPRASAPPATRGASPASAAQPAPKGGAPAAGAADEGEIEFDIPIDDDGS